MANQDDGTHNSGDLPSIPKPPGGWAVAGVVTSVLALVWVAGFILSYGKITQRIIDGSFGLSAYVEDQVVNNSKLTAYFNDIIEKQVANNVKFREELNSDIDTQLGSDTARGKILAFIREKLPPGYSGYFREFQFRQVDLSSPALMGASGGTLWFRGEANQKVLLMAAASARSYNGDPSDFFSISLDHGTFLYFCKPPEAGKAPKTDEICIPFSDVNAGSAAPPDPLNISKIMNQEQKMHSLAVKPRPGLDLRGKLGPDSLISLQSLVLVEN
jgi:hypothetical protein